MKTKYFIVLAVLLLASIACGVQWVGSPPPAPAPTNTPEVVEATAENSFEDKPLPLPEVTKVAPIEQPSSDAETYYTWVEDKNATAMRQTSIRDGCEYEPVTFEVPEGISSDLAPDAVTSIRWLDTNGFTCGLATIYLFEDEEKYKEMMENIVTTTFSPAAQYSEIDGYANANEIGCLEAEAICFANFLEVRQSVMISILIFAPTEVQAEQELLSWRNGFLVNLDNLLNQ
jgi:hypothetical protein